MLNIWSGNFVSGFFSPFFFFKLVTPREGKVERELLTRDLCFISATRDTITLTINSLQINVTIYVVLITSTTKQLNLIVAKRHVTTM